MQKRHRSQGRNHHPNSDRHAEIAVYCAIAIAVGALIISFVSKVAVAWPILTIINHQIRYGIVTLSRGRKTAGGVNAWNNSEYGRNNHRKHGRIAVQAKSSG